MAERFIQTLVYRQAPESPEWFTVAFYCDECHKLDDDVFLDEEGKSWCHVVLVPLIWCGCRMQALPEETYVNQSQCFRSVDMMWPDCLQMARNLSAFLK